MNPADRIACRETYIRKYGSREAVCPVCGACYLTPKGGRSIARCLDCLAWSRDLKGRAHLLVAKEIKSGRLARPATLQCADCESEADVYDHRDYYEPLRVEAVCMVCNARRGPAHPFRPIFDAPQTPACAIPQHQPARQVRQRESDESACSGRMRLT